LNSPLIFITFIEFAKAVLGVLSKASTTHVFWSEKTPNDKVTPSPSQNPMAYRFIDPTLFLQHGAQHQMINGCPLMRRVVVDHVPQRNND